MRANTAWWAHWLVRLYTSNVTIFKRQSFCCWIILLKKSLLFKQWIKWSLSTWTIHIHETVARALAVRTENMLELDVSRLHCKRLFGQELDEASRKMLPSHFQLAIVLRETLKTLCGWTDERVQMENVAFPYPNSFVCIVDPMFCCLASFVRFKGYWIFVWIQWVIRALRVAEGMNKILRIRNWSQTWSKAITKFNESIE